VPHADVLMGLAEAMVAGDGAGLVSARSALLEAMGPEELVDAVAVASNFERMVRIADSTGIPLDTPVVLMTEDIREDLGLDHFVAAAHTPPPTAIARLAGRVMRPLMVPIMRLVGKQFAKRSDS
jgi:hypothetical protein